MNGVSGASSESRCVGKCHNFLTPRKPTLASSNEKVARHKHVNYRYSEESGPSTSHAMPPAEDCLVVPELLQPYDNIVNEKKKKRKDKDGVRIGVLFNLTFLFGKTFKIPRSFVYLPFWN